jgi:hypothetical protein
MSHEYFDEMLQMAAAITQLADAEGTLDKREWKKAKEQYDSLEAKFIEVRNKYVDVLLATPEGHAEAYELVRTNLEEIKAACDPSWGAAVQYTSEKLLPKLQKEASRDPRTRMAVKAAPWVFGGLAIIAYFGVRFWAATPITHSLETKDGIQERAAALVKLIRYDDWMQTHVRKGGWLKGILLWPIEPTEDEIKGASDLVGLEFAAQKIASEQFACQIVYRSQGTPSKDELDYLKKAAEYLRGPTVKWEERPVFTAITAARSVGKC